MYDNIERISKYIKLHIGTNDTTKNTSNEVLDKILSLKTFVMNVSENCKVIILA